MKPPVLYQQSGRVSAFWRDDERALALTEDKAIANLAVEVHNAGLQFAAWPIVTRTHEPDWDATRIQLEVYAIPRELVPT